MNPTVRSFQTTPLLINQAAAHWTSLLHQRDPQKPFLVALSGGRTAQALFNAFAKLNTPEALQLVHFFWADERCVPPDHPESNFIVAQQELFAPLRIPPNQIHRIQGEQPASTAATHAELDLRTLTQKTVPSFDLVLLGMGEDGHTASLFPGQSSPQDRLFYEVLAPKPPPKRITMSYSLLQAANHILTLISGSGKALALEQSLKQGTTPLGKLIRLRNQMEIWCDFLLTAR